MAQDGDDKVAFAGFRDLLLEGGARLVILVFPADGLELGHAGKLAVQALDHALNAALMLAYVASSSSGDRVGLLTFADRVLGYLPPRKGKTQIFAVLQALYNLGTTTVESDYAAALRHLVHRGGRKRSLIVVFTDILDLESSRGLISHLSAISSTHLCLCVAISDPALRAAADSEPKNAEQVYQQAIARNILEERAQVKAALMSKGITVVDVPPSRLSPAVVNGYLRLKSLARL
jgi:uncharacterized protein (DUF58 family)